VDASDDLRRDEKPEVRRDGLAAGLRKRRRRRRRKRGDRVNPLLGLRVNSKR